MGIGCVWGDGQSYTCTLDWEGEKLAQWGWCSLGGICTKEGWKKKLGNCCLHRCEERSYAACCPLEVHPLGLQALLQSCKGTLGGGPHHFREGLHSICPSCYFLLHPMVTLVFGPNVTSQIACPSYDFEPQVLK